MNTRIWSQAVYRNEKETDSFSLNDQRDVFSMLNLLIVYKWKKIKRGALAEYFLFMKLHVVSFEFDLSAHSIRYVVLTLCLLLVVAPQKWTSRDLSKFAHAQAFNRRCNVHKKWAHQTCKKESAFLSF